MSRANYRDTIVTNAEASEQEKAAREQHQKATSEDTKKKKGGGPMDMLGSVMGMFGGGEGA